MTRDYVTLESLLVNGTKHAEEVETSVGTFQVRPLSKGERDTVKSIGQRGIRTDMDMPVREAMQNRNDKSAGLPQSVKINLDMETLTASSDAAQNQLVAFGLSVESKSYKPRDVERARLSDDDFNLLVGKILEISDMKLEDVEFFREFGISDSDTGGDTAGADFEGNDGAAGEAG